MVAWACAIYQYHVNGTDTVGQSVDAHGPVDHASVGLAQARPNHIDQGSSYRSYVLIVMSHNYIGN